MSHLSEDIGRCVGKSPIQRKHFGIEIMKRLAFKSIRSNLTFWFVTLGLMPLLVFVMVAYNQQARSIEKEAFDKLVAIRDLKVIELGHWLTEKTNDLNTIALNSDLTDLEKIFSKDQKDLIVVKRVRDLLTAYLKIKSSN